MNNDMIESIRPDLIDMVHRMMEDYNAELFLSEKEIRVRVDEAVDAIIPLLFHPVPHEPSVFRADGAVPYSPMLPLEADPCIGCHGTKGGICMNTACPRRMHITCRTDTN